MSDSMDDDRLLKRYVLNELERINAERDWPLIASSLRAHLAKIVAAWPDVTVLGVPYDQGGRQLAEQILGGES